MPAKFKDVTAKLTSVVLALILVASAVIPAAAVEATRNEYSFKDNSFVLHSSDDNIRLNECAADIKGNLYSSTSVDYTGSDESFNVTGTVLEGDKGDACKAADYIDLINASAEYDFTIETANSYSGEFNLEESSIYAKESLGFNEAVFNGSGNITAKGDISMHILSKKAEEQTAVIMSENGDITINSSQLTFNGLIYAPNGKVTINSKNIDFCGAVYAKQIEINGTSLTMEYKNYLPDELVCDAGEDVITYIEDGASLFASCNYSDANVVFSVDKAQQELVKITAADTLTPSFEFTQAGEYEITLTATLNNTKAVDTVKITVKPEPVVTFTSTEDFTNGELSSASGDNDELKLAAKTSESKSASAEYNKSNENGRGISVSFNQSKTEVNSTEDSLDLDYTFSGYGKAEYEIGNDMILLVDNSGSMTAKLDTLKQAALNILEYMGPNDRFGLSDLRKVHLELTNDKEALTEAINKCTKGSGASDYLSGVDTYALPMFDELSESRDKYIILLADGETPASLTRYDEEGNPYIVTIEDIAQSVYDANVRVITFQMNDDDIYNSVCGYAMQELASKSRGFYKQSIDAEEIAGYMTQFADEVYNSAGSDATFKVTVTDKAYLDTANMTVAPASTVENEDGSVTLEWKYASIDIDEVTQIKLPLKTQLLTGTGYKVIARDASLTYYDRSGKATLVSLEDVVVGRNDYADNASWQSKVYDSGKDGCTWSLVSWNANYAGTSAIDVYLSVSNDGEFFSEPVKVMNNQTLTDLKGRYIKAEVKLRKSEDGSTPVLYDLTVYALDGKTPDSTILGSRANINCSGEAIVNKPVTALLDIVGDNANLKEIKWSATDSENVTISGDSNLLKHLTFTKAGDYTLTADVVTEDKLEAKASLNITVKENPLFDKENSEANLPSLSMNITGLPTVLKAGVPLEFNISYNDPSRVAWTRVSYDVEQTLNNRRAAKVEETGNVTIATGNRKSITVQIEAFDKYGNCVRETRVITFDTKAPNASLSFSPSIAYIYNTVTVTATASDDYGIASEVLEFDGEPVELDENNQFTFTETVPGTHTLYYLVTDVNGWTKPVTRSFTVNDDVLKPSCSIYFGSSVVLGNSIDLKAQIYDNFSGLKAYSMTINGEPVELTRLEDQKNYYSYLFTPQATGEYVVVVTAEDYAGNPNTITKTITCTPDTSRPGLSVALSNNEVIAGNDITVTVKATDNVGVTELHFYEDGVEKTLSEDNTYIYSSDDSNLNKDGYKYVEFKAYAKDNAGNDRTATAKLKVMKEDKDRPNALLNGYNVVSYGSKAHVTAVASDNIAVADIKLYVNGTEVELDENNRYFYDTSDFYTYELKLVVTDTSGNEKEATKTVVVKDTSRPSISLNKDKSKYVIGDTAVFTAKITENHKLATVTASFDGKTVELTQAENIYTYTAQNLTAGSHRFEITATDVSGNSNTSYTAFTIADTLPPVVEISSDKEKYAVDEIPAITYVIEDNVGITQVEAYINDEAIEYTDGKLVLPDSYEPGTSTISVKASDGAGNYSEDSCTFEVMKSSDVSDPRITECLVSPVHWQVGETAYITVKATDDSGTVITTLSLGGTELNYDELNDRFEFVPTAEGYVEILIHIEDETGNYTESTLKKYVYASLENHKLVVTADKVLPLGDTATITLSSSDNYPFTTTSVYCNTTKESLAGENNVFTFTTDTKGEYSFTASGTDAEGISDSVDFTITVASGYEAEISTAEMQAYLETTNETSLTDEMCDTVSTFTSPVDAYSYVVNNVKYECYINSRRGSIGAYEIANGNDVDQASLLIAFLRKMGYPARYVSGNITLDEAQLKSLFAAEDYISACQMFSNSGRSVTMNSAEKILKMDEVWVEVYVPYSMLGVTDSSIKDLGVWVSLDPSIKASELDVFELETDQQVAQMKNSYNAVLEKYETDDLSELFEDLKQQKVYDTTSERFTVQRTFTVLPSNLQYTVNSEKSRFTHITEAMSDTISFTISDMFDSSSLGTYKISDLYSKRVTIQYTGDTGQATIFEMEASQVAYNSFKPALTIDGEIVAYGLEATLGNKQSLEVTMKSGGSSESFVDELQAGGMYSVVVNTGFTGEKLYNGMFEKALEENPIEGEKAATKTSYYSEAQIGSFLAYAGNLYFLLENGNSYLSAARHNVEESTRTKCAVVGYDINVEENMYGVYTKVLPGNFFIDLNLNTTYSVSRTGDVEARNSHVFSSSYTGSFYEGYIWQLLLCHNGISTVHILSYAMEQGAQLLPVFQSNYDEQIEKLSFLSSTDKNEIQNAVNNGYSVLIPDKQITIDEWSGTGYIIADLKDYNKFVYKISGGLNGGGSSEKDDLAEVIHTGITEEFFESIGADYDEFYCESFGVAHIMHGLLEIKDQLTSLKGAVESICMDELINLGALSSSVKTFYEYSGYIQVDSHFANDYYVDMLDSILLYAEAMANDEGVYDDMEGVHLLTNALIRMMCDLTYTDTDIVAKEMSEILNGGSIYDETIYSYSTVTKCVISLFKRAIKEKVT